MSYTRTIGRSVTNALPAWRTAMSAEDTLYYVGTSTPESAPALSGMPTQFGSAGTGSFGAGWDVISGYASGANLADVGGPFGKMVYGVGGHTRVQNQILSIDLNADDPTYGWWHQPTWETADQNSADFYWSPTESAALQAGGRGSAAYINPANETATAATWDRAFPVAFGDWIFPRKMTTGQMGSNVPHGFRYKTTAFIPSSVTGGDPLYLAMMGPQGPFGQGAIPDGSNDGEWFVAGSLVSGQRKWPYYFRNCVTGDWTMHQWQPDITTRGNYSGSPIGVFTDIKRVYVVGVINSTNAYFYFDFTLGYAGHTKSSPVTSRKACSGFAGFAFSEGDALGRHFAVGLAYTATPETKIVVYDFDTDTDLHVDLAADGFSVSPVDEYVNFTYDAANSRVLVLARNTTTYALEYWSIEVPAVLTNTAGWVCSAKRTPSLGDAGMSSTHFGGADRMAHLYGKSDFLPRLGVCLVPFNQNRMLAFRPSV